MKRRRIRVVSTVVFTLALALASTLAYAQGASGTMTLSGSVVDTSGGVVPGADIVAKHNQTATEYRAVSGANGRFEIPAIGPGVYTVTVSLMGFKTVVLPDVTVITGTPATIKPIVLEVGQLSETVTVTGATEVVQTQTAAVTTTLTTKQISQTPLPTRNTLDFVTALPGVNVTTSLRGATVMGLPGSALNITIDGINTQDQALKSTSGSSFFSMINPRLDAVEEVSVSTANPGAESSGQGSVQIRFQTRSGTNKFSGSGYWFLRRTNWNSNYWFNEFQNSPSLPNDKADLNTFGFRVGGPMIPDKAFYFFNYEEFRQPLSVTRTRTILTKDSLAGLFDYGSGKQVNLLQLAAQNGYTSTTDPAMMQMLTAIDATRSQASITPGSNSVTDSLAFQNTSTNRRIYPTGRVDVNVTRNNRVGVSAYVQRYISNPDILNGADPRFPGFSMEGGQWSWRPAVMGNWRTVFGANLVNELRGGYTSWKATHFFDNVKGADFAGNILPSVPLVTSPYPVSNYELRAAPLLNFDDTLNWIKGAHSFSFGGSFTRVGYNDTFQWYTPHIGIGFDTATDPANAIFNSTYFPGASSTDLSNARQLYALLTGRVTSLNNTAFQDPGTGQYAFMGPWQYWVKQQEYGFFVQDSWKLKPNLTVNGGVRWEVQLPFYGANHYFTQLSDYNMLYGVSGTDANGNPNYFVPGAKSGTAPTVVELKPGEPPFNTDWNNIAPSAGVAWRPSLTTGSWVEKLLGKDPVFRGGYSKAYTREGMSTTSDIFGYNPGGWIDASRNASLNNLLNDNLGYPLLLRQTNRLAYPTFNPTPAYPLSPSVTASINAFYPDTQTPWVHSFNLSYQRALNKDMAVDIRYVGTRARGGWIDGGYNLDQLNVMTNGWMDEFKHAQANYLINEQTYGWNTTKGNTFAYNALPGQFPLPIMQAFFSGTTASASPGDYKSSQYTNTTQLGYLVPTNPNPRSMAGQFWSNGSYRANGLAAGYPANFFYMNPAVNGAYVTGRPQDGIQSNYDAMQVELRRRMSSGFLVSASYQYIVRQTRSQNISLMNPSQDWYTQGSPVHSVKVNWVYELPFGQGKPFASGVSRNLNRLVGGWDISGLARIQSGNILDFGNYRLVGMTDADLQAMYQIRIVPDAANANVMRVFTLPDDVIKNTILAYSTSYSSATGYSGATPTGRYFAPINSGSCIEMYQGSCGQAIHHYVTGPAFLRIDASVGKKVDITSRVYGEIRCDIMNVLNNVDFRGVTLPTSNVTTYNSYQTQNAYRDSSNTQDPGGRLIQLNFRLSW